MTVGLEVLKVTARMSLLGGISLQNVFWAQKTTGASTPDADVLADMAAWLETIYDGFVTSLHTSVLFEDIAVHAMIANQAVGITAWPTLNAGTAAVDPLPTGVALVWTAYTAINRVRGRKFLGGLTEGAVTSSLWIASVITTGVSAALSWITPFTGATSTESYEPGVLRTGGGFETFREVTVRAIPGYQRRRKQDVGI
jgi:hypothetical protein